MDKATRNRIASLCKVVSSTDTIFEYVNKELKLGVTYAEILEIKKAVREAQVAEAVPVASNPDIADLVAGSSAKQRNKTFLRAIFKEAMNNDILLHGFTPETQKKRYLEL